MQTPGSEKQPGQRFDPRHRRHSLLLARVPAVLRFILLTGLLIAPNLTAYTQIYNASDTYANGQKKFKGRFVVCSTRDERFPILEIFEKRKFGKWIAYNSNGTIKEIRYYTSKGKDCKTPIQKKGEWKHFNNNGILYLRAKYVNDTLVHSTVDVYEDSLCLGTVIRTYMGFKKLPPSENRNTTNLIMNPSFQQYFYKPIEIISSGQDQIENLIPYWYSPDTATPDYFNAYRKVAGVPDNVHPFIHMAKGNGYVGLMLYLGEKAAVGNLVSDIETRGFVELAPDYKESMQAKLADTLVGDSTYCFKMKILLSSNAGYSVDRFGVLFSNKPAYYSYLEAPTQATLSFTSVLNDSRQWKTLCKTFVAKGDETYITLGRFSSLEETSILQHDPDQSSELDVNRAAYYLIDDLQLYEVQTPEICGCDVDQPLAASTEKPINFESFDQEHQLQSNRFVLSNILFDFDEIEVKRSFIPELDKLLDYLKSNKSVRIMIKAFTDDQGANEYNIHLSRKRANTIASWLIEKGISTDRIIAEGYGSSNPIVDNTSDANRAINRRVEVIFMRD